MWDFVTAGNKRAGLGRWTWARYGGGLMLASSAGGFASLNEALADAELHGFVSCSDRWEVIDGPGTVTAPRASQAAGGKPATGRIGARKIQLDCPGAGL